MSAGALAALLLVSPAGAQAPVTDVANLDQRLTRIERLLNAGALVQLLENVKALQLEMRNLRGELELQAHSLAQLKQRQRDLYLDVDRRLQRLEVGGLSVPTAPSTGQLSPGATIPDDATTIGSSGDVTTTTEPADVDVTPSGTLSTTEPIDASGTPAPAVPIPTTGDAALTGSTDAAAQVTPEPDLPAIDPVAEQQAYQDAFNLLKAGRYDKAAASFQNFIAEYSTGNYGDNAQYWLGETYYVTRRFELALVEFQRLVADYPDSQKLTHALLKVGYIHDELGQGEEALRVLENLSKRYPQSTAAGLARKRLLRMRSQ